MTSTDELRQATIVRTDGSPFAIRDGQLFRVVARPGMARQIVAGEIDRPETDRVIATLPDTRERTSDDQRLSEVIEDLTEIVVGSEYVYLLFNRGRSDLPHLSWLYRASRSTGTAIAIDLSALEGDEPSDQVSPGLALGSDDETLYLMPARPFDRGVWKLGPTAAAPKEIYRPVHVDGPDNDLMDIDRIYACGAMLCGVDTRVGVFQLDPTAGAWTSSLSYGQHEEIPLGSKYPSRRALLSGDANGMLVTGTDGPLRHTVARTFFDGSPPQLLATVVERFTHFRVSGTKAFAALPNVSRKIIEIDLASGTISDVAMLPKFEHPETTGWSPHPIELHERLWLDVDATRLFFFDGKQIVSYPQ